MPISLKKGQKVSLTKENPGLKNVVVGIGWDINAFDTGGDFDLDAAAFCLTDSGKVSDQKDFVFYGNLTHPSGAIQHMGFLLKINVIIGQYRHRRFSFHTAVPDCGN